MNHIVLIDLDKTLIDMSYQPTGDLSEVVSRCKKQGITLGLCSDTPLDPLMRWATSFGFDGPVVAELGSLLWYPRLNPSVIFTNPHTRQFTLFRSLFVTKAVENKWAVFVGDNTEFVRRGLTINLEHKKLLLVSGYRTCSLGFHIRTPNGFSSEDQPLLEEALALARESIEDHGFPLDEYWFNYDVGYGFSAVHSRSTKKRLAVRVLMDMNPSTRVDMVGDSNSDFIDDPRVQQYAVGNASEEYKKRCVYVADRTYTQGVEEVLNHILQSA